MTNQYLVWKGGELADFELKLRSRLNGQGGINNGFQFRSRPGRYPVGGRNSIVAEVRAWVRSRRRQI